MTAIETMALPQLKRDRITAYKYLQGDSIWEGWELWIFLTDSRRGSICLQVVRKENICSQGEILGREGVEKLTDRGTLGLFSATQLMQRLPVDSGARPLSLAMPWLRFITWVQIYNLSYKRTAGHNQPTCRHTSHCLRLPMKGHQYMPSVSLFFLLHMEQQTPPLAISTAWRNWSTKGRCVCC